MQDTTFNISGAPDHELARSPAAAAVGRLAAASDLFLAHFEYRAHLEPPEHWLPSHRPDLGEPTFWDKGVLAESKYQSFRNDLILGSFHPGHQAKWTAHELCHGLIGFAWEPNATHFYHALAARLSELLPVALFYFFDEAHLRRCPLHIQGGPLFGSFCWDCERLAAKGPVEEDPTAERFMDEGRAFVRRELDAVRRSLKSGQPVTSPWANIDLMSDGLAYASAHGARLCSPQFQQYISWFCPEGSGYHSSLEALEARIFEVMGGICHGSEVAPLRGNRWLWACQDIGWRLLEVSSETKPAVSTKLLDLAELLAKDPGPTAMEQVIHKYTELAQEFLLPEQNILFGTGYHLPLGTGLCLTQIAEGLESALPRTWTALEEAPYDREQMTQDFAAQDHQVRLPLGRRFLSWLEVNHQDELLPLARLEAAITHAKPINPVSISLEPRGQGGRWCTASDVEVISITPALLKEVLDDVSLEQEPFVAIRRDPSGEVAIIRISQHLGIALLQLQKEPALPTEVGLDENDLELLCEWNLIVPQSFTLRKVVPTQPLPASEPTNETSDNT